MKRVMFIKWGENGPESSPQSEPGDTSGAWLPCTIVALDAFNPTLQELRYHKNENTVTQYIAPITTTSIEE
jgi:hypothetical protein